MTTLIIVAVAVLLISATVLIHYEVLRKTGHLLPRLPIRPRQRVLVVISACFGAHFIEIALYACMFAVLQASDGFGRIEGAFSGSVLDFFYFATTSYTTLGIGEIYPAGPIRIIAATASLNGFLLITWSASFTYLMMQRYWHPELDG
ncbi:ion channel [Roseovarius sp. D22-M7]|uniref:ion channel n=1 Tax=Roseovarius sp. D22-M7 TaxID=3127116 RepID=UPI00300F9EF2